MKERTDCPRVRTVPQALEEIKKVDPNTAITLRALRRMVSTGEIPSVNIASKRLIDMGLLFEHLSCYNSEGMTRFVN